MKPIRTLKGAARTPRLRTGTIPLAVLFVGLLLYGPRLAYDCGPFADAAFFTYTIHPDLPLDGYAHGQLGILELGYARSYLYVAYRYLAGPGLDAGEQNAVVALWNERVRTSGTNASPLDQSIKQWLATRQKVQGTIPVTDIDVFAPAGNYAQYLNCTADAFLTAAHTLDGLISRFGAANDGVEDWVAAQDQVFSHCVEHTFLGPGFFRPGSGMDIPTALSGAAPPLRRADRAYQIAAAYFYTGNFEEARRRFEAIAQDPASPWSQIARLVVARSLIRQATLWSPEPGKVDAAKLAEAEQQLRQILADSRLSALHPAADQLLGFVEVRLHPAERRQELAARLVRPNSSTLKQDLWDYTVLLDAAIGGDRFADERFMGGAQTREAILSKASDDLAKNGGLDDLTDWILTFQNPGPDARSHSLDRWQSTHSLPWLVAAISKAGAESLALPRLLAAADKIEPGSSAYDTATFHALRLRNFVGQNDVVRSRLDQILTRDRGGMPASALNLFLALRMKVSTSPADWLKYAARVPAGEGIDTEGVELPYTWLENPGASKASQPRFDADATEVFNKVLPLSVLEQAARTKVLPKDLRAQVALSAWVRASLLGENEIAIRLVREVEELLPQIGRDLEGYRDSPTSEGLRFGAALVMLRNPGLSPLLESGVSRTTPVDRIDDFRDNWWCLLAPAPGNPAAPGNAMPLSGPPLHMLYPTGKPSAPLFLNAAQESAGAEEWKKLQAIGVGPNYLSRVVIEWAKGNLQDPRVPEALALAVRSTRYGCTDKQTTQWSKQAFEFLHKHYATSEWAKKTKYYY